MPRPRDEDDDRRSGGRSRGAPGRSDRSGRGRPERPERSGAPARRGGTNERGDRRGSRDRTSDGSRDRPSGPRPPIKGPGRRFDTDSAPNERERNRRSPASESEAGERKWEPEAWVDEGPVRRAAGDAVQRAKSGTGAGTGRRTRRDRAKKRTQAAMELDVDRLRRQLGATKADRTIQRVSDAADAFADERYEDARRLLKTLVEIIPNEPLVRELYGGTLYRLGKWRLAAEQLEEFARLTSTTEQHPVLADCYRALRQHGRVAELWEEIGDASLEAALVAEGRIVYAGSLADQGKLAEAIAVLEAGSLGSKKLKDHHLRMRYALADLYDRAGEQQAARRYFESVANNDADFFDVRERLRQL